jgi:signal transduction histidine kinase
MIERDLPTFEEDELNSISNQNQDVDTTETIHLDHLFQPDLTESGIYDMGDVRYEALGRLLRAIPLPVFLVDNSLRIKLVNRAAQTALKDVPGLIGSSLPSHFQSPKVRQKVLSAIKYTFQQRKSLIIEGRLRIGALPIWGRMHVRSVRIGSRRLALVLIEDLTAEKELVVTQKYRKLVHVVPAGIAEFGLQQPFSRNMDAAEALDLIMDARLVDGNRSFAVMHGFKTIEKLRGVALRTLFPFHLKGTDYYRTWINEGLPITTVETQEIGRQGELGYFENDLISNVEEDRVLGIWAVRRDITNQRRLEDRVRRSDKMEAVVSLAGGIAHEIRNPLGICSSAAQFLMEDDITPELRKEYAEKIHLSVQRASRIIEDLLCFARPRDESDRAPVRLIPIVREALRVELNNRREYEIELSLADCADEEVVVTGSAGLLQQVFSNLFANAFGAMPSGGRLTISVEKSSEEFVIRISDTGYGIEEKDLGRIFDPFYSVTPDGKGMGLGLSIAYSIVKEHSGNIEAQSQYHKGSAFTVRLPRFGI